LYLFNQSLRLALKDSFPGIEFPTPLARARPNKRRQAEGGREVGGAVASSAFEEDGGKAEERRQFWENIDNRRKFFIDFAREHGFDLYDLNRWADVSMHSLAKEVKYPV